MPEILCPNGNIVLMDELDHEKAKKYKWLAYKYNNNESKVFTLIKGKRHSMAKLIFGIEGTKCIYHKNRNPFDFKRQNIVICNNRSEFAQLAFPRVSKTSKYNNVYWSKQNSKWIAKVIFKGKIIHGGYFYEEYDAAIVSDYLLYFYYGNSLKRNFPELNEIELKAKYDDILDRYGATLHVKYAKSHQGISSNSDKLSSYVGVFYDLKGGHWSARLTFCKKTYYRRGFETDTLAAVAYDEMVLKFYGENARFNFPRAKK